MQSRQCGEACWIFMVRYEHDSELIMPPMFLRWIRVCTLYTQCAFLNMLGNIKLVVKPICNC